MEFDAILAQVLDLLQRDGRVSYRALKLRFHLNDEYIEALKDEIIEVKRQAIVQQLFQRLNGKFTEDDRKEIEGAFRLFKNQLLHGPISALTEETVEGGGHGLLEALRKLFRLQDG